MGRCDRVGVYPGSFDPITYGHLDILERALPMFDAVIVLIAENTSKRNLFCLTERKDMVLREVQSLAPRVRTDILADELLVEYCRKNNIRTIIRGLRAVNDFEYEYAITLMNRRLAPEIETIFFMTSDKYSFISSSIVREVGRLGGDLSQIVPPYVEEKLHHAFMNHTGT